MAGDKPAVNFKNTEISTSMAMLIEQKSDIAKVVGKSFSVSRVIIFLSKKKNIYIYIFHQNICIHKHLHQRLNNLSQFKKNK